MDLSGGGGAALEAQQSAAVKIPYENIAANQKALALSLGAFFHAAEVSKQRQQLENNLLTAQLKLGEEQRWHNIEMQNMAQNAATRIYAANLAAGSAQDRVNAQADRLQLAQDIFDQKVNEHAATSKSVSNLMSDLGTLKPGTSDFLTGYYDKLADPKNALGLQTPFGRDQADITIKKHNASSLTQRNKLNADMREFGYEVGTAIWGDKNNQDIAPILHRDMWKDQYVNDAGQTAGQEMANQPGWQKSGSVYFDQPMYDTKTGLPIKDRQGNIVKREGATRTVNAQWLTDMTKRYQDLQARKNTIPDQIATDTVKPQVAETAAPTFPIIPPDPTQVVPNVTYRSPKGTVGWQDENGRFHTGVYPGQ